MKRIEYKPVDFTTPPPGGGAYVIINNNIYIMKSKELKAFLRMIKSKATPHTIYAVRRGYIYEMRNDQYTDRDAFAINYRHWLQAGFEVLHTCTNWYGRIALLDLERSVLKS